jgi:hypothetical protein
MQLALGHVLGIRVFDLGGGFEYFEESVEPLVAVLCTSHSLESRVNPAVFGAG